MNMLIITSLIIVALITHSVRMFYRYNKSKTAKQWVRKEAKRSLRILFVGGVVIGIFALAISQFPYLSKLGYDLFEYDTTLLIRAILKFCLGTESVYASFSIVMYCLLMFVEVTLLLSTVTIYVAKKLLRLFMFKKEELYSNVSIKDALKSLISSFKNKFLFNFIHLRN